MKGAQTRRGSFFWSHDVSRTGAGGRQRSRHAEIDITRLNLHPALVSALPHKHGAPPLRRVIACVITCHGPYGPPRRIFPSAPPAGSISPNAPDASFGQPGRRLHLTPQISLKLHPFSWTAHIMSHGHLGEAFAPQDTECLSPTFRRTLIAITTTLRSLTRHRVLVMMLISKTTGSGPPNRRH